MLGKALAGAPSAGSAPAGPPIGMGDAQPAGNPPGPLGLLTRFPWLQGIPARVIAIGPLPEHAPDWARRPAEEPNPASRT